MRDGNRIRLAKYGRALRVVSLPMRDGNIPPPPPQPKHSVVVSLPMRDGNPGRAGVRLLAHQRC